MLNRNYFNLKAHLHLKVAMTSPYSFMASEYAVHSVASIEFIADSMAEFNDGPSKHLKTTTPLAFLMKFASIFSNNILTLASEFNIIAWAIIPVENSPPMHNAAK